MRLYRRSHPASKNKFTLQSGAEIQTVPCRMFSVSRRHSSIEFFRLGIVFPIKKFLSPVSFSHHIVKSEPVYPPPARISNLFSLPGFRYWHTSQSQRNRQQTSSSISIITMPRRLNAGVGASLIIFTQHGMKSPAQSSCNR